MAIRWDKFTVKAQEAVQRANELASEHGNPELAPAHLLAALVEDREGIVAPVLEKIGIGPQAVLSDLYKEIEKLPKVSGSAGAQQRKHFQPEAAVYLDMKHTGKPSAGNPHAGFDAAGTGNQLTVWLVRHSQRKRRETDRPNLRSMAPVLDPTICPWRSSRES